MHTPAPSAPDLHPLRILEIGGNSLFAGAVPEQTEFYWTGIKPHIYAHLALGPIRLIRSLMRLHRREFDLLVVHATQYPPWHPRSILTALRDWNIRLPRGLFAMFAWRFIHLFHDVPIAVVDLGDPCQVFRHNLFLLDACKAFFKIHLPSDKWLAFCQSSYPNFPGRRWRSQDRNRRRVEKLKPLSPVPLAVSEGFVAPEKKVDIFFAGDFAANSTARTDGIEELQALENEGYIVDFPKERLTGREFLRRMSAAWLAWSPAGLAWESSRHYEAPLVGSVPLMNHPSIVRHRPLRDGEHCVLYSVEAGGLAEAARKALADKPRLRRMAQAAAEHVRKHHNNYARADYVASTVLGRRLDGSWIESPAEQHSSGPKERAVRRRDFSVA